MNLMFDLVCQVNFFSSSVEMMIFVCVYLGHLIMYFYIPKAFV